MRAELERLDGHRCTAWDLVKNPEEEPVDNCTSNKFHYTPTVAAVKAGKHVISEKPLAMNLWEAREMYEAAERVVF